MSHRVLFVDDEPRLLEAIRRIFTRLRPEWDCGFATSGREAIDRLEATPWDVVVTDMRMPEMDGATFLGLVADRWPAIARIMLTGYPDQFREHQGPCAHVVLGKPCPPEQICEAVERTLPLGAVGGGTA